MKETKCSKCGNSDLVTRYIENNELVESSSRENINDEFVRSIEYEYYFKVKASKQHLHRHCRNCHYEWRDNVIGDKTT